MQGTIRIRQTDERLVFQMLNVVLLEDHGEQEPISLYCHLNLLDDDNDDVKDHGHHGDDQRSSSTSRHQQQQQQHRQTRQEDEERSSSRDHHDSSVCYLQTHFLSTHHDNTGRKVCIKIPLPKSSSSYHGAALCQQRAAGHSFVPHGTSILGINTVVEEWDSRTTQLFLQNNIDTTDNDGTASTLKLPILHWAASSDRRQQHDGQASTLTVLQFHNYQLWDITTTTNDMIPEGCKHAVDWNDLNHVKESKVRRGRRRASSAKKEHHDLPTKWWMSLFRWSSKHKYQHSDDDDSSSMLPMDLLICTFAAMHNHLVVPAWHAG
jgi:hypothetical protein